MKYPLRSDYQIAVKYLDKFVLDSVLQRGTPVKHPQNPNFLLSYNGGKAIVYEIQTNPKKYALKCWIEDLGDLKIRYKAIDEYLKKVKLPYFVDFSYQEQGILVNGQKFPIVRMEWIDGISFKRFLANNIKNPAYIRDLADKFLEMATNLHQNNISHGDLQHGNIMVRKNGDICLIDYDSLYVPQLNNEKDNIKGLPGYQHPKRKISNKLSPKSDYFSELVIYLSLLIISEKPNYWQKIEQEERLLFSEKDLVNPNSSQLFRELKKLSPEIVYFTQELEKFCQESNIERLQPLENLITTYTGSKVSWDFPFNPQPNLSPPPPPIKIDPNDPIYDKFIINKPQSSTANVSNLDPWSKLDTNSSNAWDKFNTSTTSNKDPWDKIDQISTPSKDDWQKIGQDDHRKQTGSTTDESIWDKFDHIWNKFAKSVSSIWDKVKKLFN